MIEDRPTTDGELPHLDRFMTASIRYEQYLLSLTFPGATVEERMAKYDHIMRSTEELSRLAQEFDFMGMVPDLADTEGRREVGARLAEQLQNPEIPQPVRDIYSSLFGQDVMPNAAT